jgi:hypothetical protein
MRFYSFSHLAEQALIRFMSGLNDRHEPDYLQKKIEFCKYRIFLISNDQPVLDRFREVDSLKLPLLFDAWQSIRGDGAKNMMIQEAGWKTIEKFGSPFFDHNLKAETSIVWRFRNEKIKDAFFILLSGNERDGLPRYELHLLSNLWQVMNDSLPVHCSGVIHKNKLFLFAGSSGAGKSTIGRFGSSLGDRVLDDDQMNIHWTNNGFFSADGWGYNYSPCDRPIRAIFKIVQDVNDYITPLSQSQVAQFVTARANEIFGARFPDDAFARLFSISSAIARQIPGYELHFRNSPDFWKVIDEQFPD